MKATTSQDKRKRQAKIIWLQKFTQSSMVNFSEPQQYICWKFLTYIKMATEVDAGNPKMRQNLCADEP